MPAGRERAPQSVIPIMPPAIPCSVVPGRDGYRGCRWSRALVKLDGPAITGRSTADETDLVGLSHRTTAAKVRRARSRRQKLPIRHSCPVELEGGPGADTSGADAPIWTSRTGSRGVTPVSPWGGVTRASPITGQVSIIVVHDGNSEVRGCKSASPGSAPLEDVRAILAALAYAVVPADEAPAWDDGILQSVTATAGLSLGDRFCLALCQTRRGAGLYSGQGPEGYYWRGQGHRRPLVTPCPWAISTTRHQVERSSRPELPAGLNFLLCIRL